MATLFLKGYRDTGSGSNLTAVSWQFAKDKEFTKIIDQSLKDTKHLKEWSSMLPKREEDKKNKDQDEYYNDLKELWGRVKIHVGEYESEWVVSGPYEQPTDSYIPKDPNEEVDKLPTYDPNEKHYITSDYDTLVTFEPNGGDYNEYYGNKSFGVKLGEYTIPGNIFTSPKLFKFKTWATDKYGKNPIAVGTKINIDTKDPLTYYAIWEYDTNATPYIEVSPTYIDLSNKSLSGEVHVQRFGKKFNFNDIKVELNGSVTNNVVVETKEETADVLTIGIKVVDDYIPIKENNSFNIVLSNGLSSEPITYVYNGYGGPKWEDYFYFTGSDGVKRPAAVIYGTDEWGNKHIVVCPNCANKYSGITKFLNYVTKYVLDNNWKKDIYEYVDGNMKYNTSKYATDITGYEKSKRMWVGTNFQIDGACTHYQEYLPYKDKGGFAGGGYQ